MPARRNIANYVYDSHDSHYKLDMAKGAKNGARSVTTAINNIIWPSEPVATESVTIDQFSTSLPAAATDGTITTETITQLPTTMTSGIDTSNLNNTVTDIITNGTQDVINQFSTSLPAAATDGTITTETITQLTTTMTSGIDTSNLNNTVTDIITNGTQDVINQFSTSLPAAATDGTITTETITQLSTTMTSGIDTSNLNNTVTDIITNGTQDVINQFSTNLPVAATDGTIITETITQLSTTMTSGIDTLNLNNTVMDIITNGTQDAMVNVVNNVVNVTNEISTPTTSANVIQNAVTSMVNLVDTTSSTVTPNITNQVPTIPPTENTSATITNVVKNTTTFVTDTISSTARNFGSEYLNDRENEGSQKGTNALLVLILLVLIFIGAFLIYIYLRHKKMGKTQHEYKVNQHEESPSTTDLQHEQIEIEQETYVQHTVT